MLSKLKQFLNIDNNKNEGNPQTDTERVIEDLEYKLEYYNKRRYYDVWFNNAYNNCLKELNELKGLKEKFPHI